jgi:hypothetical protein
MNQVLISKAATYNTSLKVQLNLMKKLLYMTMRSTLAKIWQRQTLKLILSRTKLYKFNNYESRKRGECQTFVYDPAGINVIKHFFFN